VLGGPAHGLEGRMEVSELVEMDEAESAFFDHADALTLGELGGLNQVGGLGDFSELGGPGEMLASSPPRTRTRPRDQSHRRTGSLHSIPPSPPSPSRASKLSRAHGHRTVGSMDSSSRRSLSSHGSLRSLSSRHSLVGLGGHNAHVGYTDHAQYNPHHVVSPSLTASTSTELSMRMGSPGSLRLRPEHAKFLDELDLHGDDDVASLDLHSHYDEA
jgi:hypothetical protein